MLKKLTLGTKLMIAFMAVGIVPLAVIGFMASTTASNALSIQAFAQLEGLRDAKKVQIQQHIGHLSD